MASLTHYRRRFARWNPDVVVLLIILNLAAFAVSMQVSLETTAAWGEKQPWGPNRFACLLCGANSPHYILEGQWFRLVTACFLHGSVVHLGMNLLGLYLLGRPLLAIVGPRRFTVIYLAAGLISSMVSATWRYFWYHDHLGVDVHLVGFSLGASGAVFGIFGYLLGQAARARDAHGVAQRRTLVFWLVANLMIGFSPGSNVDNAAHLGGLAVGFVLALMEGRPRWRAVTRLVRSPITVLLLVLLNVVGATQAVASYHGTFGRDFRALMAVSGVVLEVLDLDQEIMRGDTTARSRIGRLRELETEIRALAAVPDLAGREAPALFLVRLHQRDAEADRPYTGQGEFPNAREDFGSLAEELIRTLGIVSDLQYVKK